VGLNCLKNSMNSLKRDAGLKGLNKTAKFKLRLNWFSLYMYIFRLTCPSQMVQQNLPYMKTCSTPQACV